MFKIIRFLLVFTENSASGMGFICCEYTKRYAGHKPAYLFSLT